jgi:methyl-accepting chemotaxis protein
MPVCGVKGDKGVGPTMSEHEQGPGTRHRRSKTLYQITIILIAVFFFFGIATFFIYSGSQNRLIDKSTEKLIQTEVDILSTASSFFVDFVVSLAPAKVKEASPQSVSEAAAKGELTKGQEYLNDQLAKLVDSGFLGVEGAMVILPPSELSPEAMVVAASDQGLIYNWDVPDYLTEAITSDAPYLWVDEDLPDLGLTGKSLLVLEKVIIPGAGLEAAFVATKPMDSDIAAINQFYDEKRSSGNFDMMLVTVVSIAIIALLTFIFLFLLIRKRITRPLEELSAAAHQVMEGDLDVEIEIRRGEEFAGLKHAFRTMVGSLAAIISTPSVDEDARPARQTQEWRRTRSHTILYVTAFVAVMFLALGVVGFVAFNRTQNKLIDESMEKMVQITVDSFSTGSNYVRETLDTMVMDALAERGLEPPSTAEVYGQFFNKQLSVVQKFYDRMTKDMVDRGVLGMENLSTILIGNLIPGGAAVVVSSDESLVYQWDIPDYLIQAIEDEVPYLYLQDGVPELGLQGEYVIAIQNYELEGFLQAYIGIKPMHEEIAEMQGFYASEKRGIYMVLVPVMVGFILALTLLSFLLLNFLIHRNITRPVDELSVVAEQVMQGNLDVAIPIREGEEFEDLKIAFREIVDTFRKLIARSTGDH